MKKSITFLSLAAIVAAGIAGWQAWQNTKLTERLQTQAAQLSTLTNQLQAAAATLTNQLQTAAATLTNQAQAAATALNDSQNIVTALREEVSRLAPLADKARKMPVALSQRPALLGNGIVFRIQNISAAVLPVHVKLTRPTGNMTKTFNLVLDSGAVGTISYTDGWAVATGDQAEITSEGFDPLTTKF
jgi:hypothetical protein